MSGSLNRWMKNIKVLIPILVSIVLGFGVGYFSGVCQCSSSCESTLEDQFEHLIFNTEDAVNQLGLNLDTFFESLDESRELLEKNVSNEAFGYLRAESKYVFEWTDELCYERRFYPIEFNLDKDDLHNVHRYFAYLYYLLELMGDTDNNSELQYQFKLLKSMKESLYGDRFYDTSNEHLTVIKLLQKCDIDHAEFKEIQTYIDEAFASGWRLHQG